MKVNLARWDRALRYGFGFLLTLWAAAGGPWWAWIGFYLIASASWGLCPIYVMMNVRTAPSDRRRSNEDLEDLSTGRN
ncbi:MAG: DUF2892 domain-containing protein [Bdellovibrionaceae bacterium]|nr:DUF2892 domain-containing protein [Pseudobdellovibrionaceae bacterium]